MEEEKKKPGSFTYREQHAVIIRVATEQEQKELFEKTKAIVRGGLKHVTSRGLRMTIIKFIQYGAFLIITHVLVHFTVNGISVSPLAFIDSWAFSLLILIEVKSVYENIVAINPKLDFIRPLIERISAALKTGGNDEK